MENSVVKLFAKDLSLGIDYLTNSDDEEFDPMGVIFWNHRTDDSIIYDRQGLQELIDGLQQMANQLPY